MNTKTILMIPSFKQFIKESYSGKRLKPDGGRIKLQTVDNYKYVLKYLEEYEMQLTEPLRIKIMRGSNSRIFNAEKNYWKKFYFNFTQFLYSQKNCHDNYVGSAIKNIRAFFNYLRKEKGMETGDFHRNFYVCKEEIPIVTLLPGQLQFLINDGEYDKSLKKHLKISKDIFVFGCTVALRYSDLFKLKFTDIENVEGGECRLAC